MRMRTIGAVAFGLMLGAGWGWAVAAEKAETKDDGGSPLKGLYLQGGPLMSFEAFDLPSDFNTRDPWGADGRVGYRFHPHLAGELQFQWVSPYEITSGGAKVGEVETYTFTGNGKVYAFDSPFDVYALFGIGFQHAAISGIQAADKTEFAIRVGGGAEVKFWKGLGMYGELTYVQPVTSLSDFGAVPLSFGVKYTFE